MRVEALRHLLNVSEPAVMNIVLEDSICFSCPSLSALAVASLDNCRSLVSEYLVQMVQVRLDAKIAGAAGAAGNAGRLQLKVKAVDYDNKSGSIRFAGVNHRLDAAKAAMN
jgi:hypothetical protein